MMRRYVLLCLLSCLAHPSAFAQAGTGDPTAFIPKYSVALGYNNIRANAPPADCGCFDMSGGFASLSVPVRYWLSAAAEVTGGHANTIGPLGQDLTLTTYTVGPQVTLRGTRFVPFAQALFGAAHGSDSYFPSGNTYSTAATSFAYSTGGGLDFHLNHRLAIRMFEAQYLHTGFPNAGNNSQSHLMLGAGVVFKLRGHYAHPRTEAPRPAPQPRPIVLPPPPSPVVMPPSSNSAVVRPMPAKVPGPVSDADFHEHIRDIFFDYDSATLRPDAESSIEAASAYLLAHPDLHLQVSGFADERGTVEYNFNLSKRRAEAAARALAATGVPEDRIRVVSFGKTVEVCTAQDEACWQRNRRAAFLPAP